VKKALQIPRVRVLNPAQRTRAKRAYLTAFLSLPACQVTDALALGGVTLSELERWRAEDEDFAGLERQLKDQRRDDDLRSQIEQYIALGDKDIIKSAMKRLPEFNPARKTELEVRGKVIHEHLTTKSDEELEQIIRAGLVMDADFQVVEPKREITKG